VKTPQKTAHRETEQGRGEEAAEADTALRAGDDAPGTRSRGSRRETPADDAGALHAVFQAFPGMVCLWVDHHGTVRRREGGEAPCLAPDAVGRSVRDVLAPEALDTVQDALERVRASGRALTTEFSQSFGGHTRHYEVRLARVREELFLLLLRDVSERRLAQRALQRTLEDLDQRVRERTHEISEANRSLLQEVMERKQAEHDLGESEERFRAICDAANDGIVMLDQSGRVTFWNAAAQAMFGYTAQEMEGREALEVLARPADARRLAGTLRRTAAEGKSLEFSALRKDGVEMAVELSVSALTIGGRWHALALARDVTDRKRYQRALEEARHAAETASQLKTDFLSMVSHELRTPLTSVVGFAKIISKRLDQAVFPHVDSPDARTPRAVSQVRENLTVIVSEGERLTNLINNVLDLAKLEAGQFEWRMEPVAVGQVIRQSLAATEVLFHDKGLRLVVDMEEDLPPVLADETRLIQVLINLLSNAAKFTEQGSVACAAHSNGQEIVVCVRDTGCGVSEEDCEDIFDRFRQLGDTLTGKPVGTGLGLPICREIVEHHGGRIWVESEPGKGSAFRFTLPCACALAESGVLGSRRVRCDN
jgi:PAS domain S-box-containing protein